MDVSDLADLADLDELDLTRQEARKLCITYGDWHRSRYAIIRAAHYSGMTINEIAAKMGLSRQTVTACLNRAKEGP